MADVMLAPTPGFSGPERFSNDEVSISSLSYECPHGKHYEVEVRNKACGHRRIVHHTHSYSDHWDAMYDASERLIVQPALAAFA